MKRIKILLVVVTLLFAELACPTRSVSADTTQNKTTFDPWAKAQLEKVKTPLCGGDTIKAILSYLAPIMQSLATGTVSNDEVTWKFKNAPFYIEDSTKALAKQALTDNFCHIIEKDCGGKYLSFITGDSIVGIFNVWSFKFKTKTRMIKQTNGKKIYRCAITGIFVQAWCDPTGDECSRQEALDYYNACQEKIQLAVSKVIAARQPNGEPLTIEQKLKWIHDWIIIGAHCPDAENRSSFDLLTRNEYGALIDGEIVCQGYTRAFKAILEELVRQTGLDVQCEEAIDNKFKHVWVRVKFNENWYVIDITNDEYHDFGTGVYSPFFLISDFQFISLWNRYFAPHIGEWPGFFSYHAYEEATDCQYQNMNWDVYKKDISEFTVTIKDSSLIDAAVIGDSILPKAVEVKYGKNIVPPEFYRVSKVTETNGSKQTSVVVIVTPSPSCNSLCGYVEVPGTRKPAT